MDRTVICPQCGKEFIATHPSSKFCSAECKRESKIQRSRRCRELKMYGVNRRTPQNKTDWAAIVRECKAAGLSYGEATARGII